jgi:hypothetical protein
VVKPGRATKPTLIGPLVQMKRQAPAGMRSIERGRLLAARRNRVSPPTGFLAKKASRAESAGTYQRVAAVLREMDEPDLELQGDRSRIELLVPSLFDRQPRFLELLYDALHKLNKKALFALVERG